MPSTMTRTMYQRLAWTSKSHTISMMRNRSGMACVDTNAVEAYTETDLASLLELDEIVSRVCPTQDLIDDALRSFLTVATSSRGT